MIFIKNIAIQKANLLPTIQKIFPQSVINDYCRIEDLIKQLQPDLWYLVEYPYIDNVWRDNYYTYYSSKLKEFPRDTIRIHIFSDRLEDEKMSTTYLQSLYLGFFIVRPVSYKRLGQSYINPKAFTKHNFICCCSEKVVHLLGYRLTVKAFPHIAQDEEAMTCAESSIWSLQTYFGSKYNEYRQFLPSEFMKKIIEKTGHRVLPSRGLSFYEIAMCMSSTNQDCLPYPANNCFNVMQVYIESGIPFLCALTSDKQKHATLAIGHEVLNQTNVANDLALKMNTNKNWYDVSDYNKKLVFIDDNFSPYVVDNCEGIQNRYNVSWSNTTINSFIVPLEKTMYLEALYAIKLIETIFNDPINGLTSKKSEKWITRLFLTKSSAFKESLINDCYLDDIYKEFYNTLYLPKFIWACEIYRVTDYPKNICSGLLLIDETGNNSCESIINYVIDDEEYKFTDGLLQKTKGVLMFRKQTFIHNLEGDWV